MSHGLQRPLGMPIRKKEETGEDDRMNKWFILPGMGASASMHNALHVCDIVEDAGHLIAMTNVVETAAFLKRQKIN
jgi:hypothetical protein